MALIDISPAFVVGMPGWPGDTPFQVEQSCTIGPGCPVNVSKITLSSHVGAHADAPLHFDAMGRSIDTMPLELYIGPCHVVDARGGQGPIQPDEILPALPLRLDRVLIRQYERQPRRWDASLRGLSPALIDALADRGCRLIGVDAASVDPATSKTLDAHHAIERRGIAIIEGLLLDHVVPGAYELIAPPLRITGCDAAPLRAVLRTL